MGAIDASSNVVGKRFRVIASYEPQQEDELSLLVGDVLTVIHLYDDGWILAENRSTKAKGLAPGNFLEPYNHHAAIPQPRASLSPEEAVDSLYIQRLNVSDQFKASHRMSSRISTDEMQSFLNMKRPQLVVNNASDEEDAYSDKPRASPMTHVDPRSPAGSAASSLTGSQDFNRVLARLRGELEHSSFRSIESFNPANVGSVNVFICGDTGIGKSSLIDRFINHQVRVPTSRDSKSFVVSAMKPGAYSFENPVSLVHQAQQLDIEHSCIMVTKCSTIPLDQTIEGEEKFNLKFMELPGFGYFTDAFQTIRQSVEYCQRQFLKTNRMFAKGTGNEEQISKFVQAENGSHQHVDCCFYLILHRLKPVDLEYMYHISQFTNIIPLIIKSDTLSQREILQLKLTVLLEMQKKNIVPYGFGLSTPELITATEEALKILKDQLMKHNNDDDPGKFFDQSESKLKNILNELKGLLPYAVSCKRVVSDGDKKPHLANGRPTTLLDINFSADLVGTSPIIDRNGSSDAQRKFTYPADEFDYMFRDVFVTQLPKLRAEVARKFLSWRSKLPA